MHHKKWQIYYKKLDIRLKKYDYDITKTETQTPWTEHLVMLHKYLNLNSGGNNRINRIP